MSILCATDFSSRGVHGLHAAAALASKLHDSIDLIHVLAPIDGEMPNVFFDDVQRVSGERLLQEATHLRELGATVQTHLPVGPVAESIDDFASREKPRLIVVSAVGRSAPADWLLGSTAERTAERVHTPTLVVRDSVPIEAWTQGKRPLTVLVACDFTLSSRAALCWTRQLAELGPCKIFVVRIVSENERSASNVSISAEGGAIDPMDAAQKELAEWVQPLIGDFEPQVYCLPSLGRPDFRLIEFAEQNRVDLIVTGTRQKHGLQRIRSGSFSRGLLRYAPMNVACVPLADSRAALDGRLPVIERVLVAVDFADPTHRALSFACSLIRQGGTLQLVSVIRPGYEDKTESFKQRLREQVPAIASELNITTEVVVITAHDIASAICNEAERFGAHVICVGTRGSNSMSIALLGSIAHAVSAQSRRPVLLVPHLPA